MQFCRDLESQFTKEADSIVPMGQMMYVDVSTDTSFRIDSSGNQVKYKLFIRQTLEINTFL